MSDEDEHNLFIRWLLGQISEETAKRINALWRDADVVGVQEMTGPTGEIFVLKLTQTDDN